MTGNRILNLTFQIDKMNQLLLLNFDLQFFAFVFAFLVFFVFFVAAFVFRRGICFSWLALIRDRLPLRG